MSAGGDIIGGPFERAQCGERIKISASARPVADMQFWGGWWLTRIVVLSRHARRSCTSTATMYCTLLNRWLVERRSAYAFTHVWRGSMPSANRGHCGIETLTRSKVILVSAQDSMATSACRVQLRHAETAVAVETVAFWWVSHKSSWCSGLRIMCFRRMYSCMNDAWRVRG